MFFIIALILVIPLSIIFSVLFYYFGPSSGEDIVENKIFSCGLGIASAIGVSFGFPILLPIFLFGLFMYFILGFITSKIDSGSSKLSKVLEIIKGKDE